ncbi:MAG: hypothetical protein AVDCRST_MAG26-3683 [uncultured Chloroflexia bacterium]|uniref:Cell envelope-related transcriptional attenuator domain-containing protein n=1 Tax=uncultured Chloroflexia bacterium TaxID=1672391 RepID=A0A6J4JRR1_9CHLR|nr:MAG: hypothetical protein AVDCRST_MAG26-3683 [uncultured Chloroflexia bacterium]
MEALSQPTRFVSVSRLRRSRVRAWLRRLRTWGLATLMLLNVGVGYWGIPLIEAWYNIQGMERLPTPATRSGAGRPPRAVTGVGALGAPARAASPLLPGAVTYGPPVPARIASVQPVMYGPSIPARIAPIQSVTYGPPIPTQTPTIEPTPGPAGAVTVLLLGVDRRAAEGRSGRSDAIVVVRLDPARGRVRLLSLPRDLWTTIPGVGEGKINSAYAIGEREGAGAALVRETVGQLLGIGIDYTAEIDFAGFRSVIDSLGGIAVDVPRELYDPRYPTEDYGYTVAHFLPGRQVMDGEQALMFSRMRHPDSDFERMRRQQLVLLAVAERLKERGVARNLAAANDLTAAVSPHIRSDMPPTLALRVLWGLRDVDSALVERTTVDSNLLMETNIGGAYALLDTTGVLRSLGANLVAAE